jgi:hypothetical protein
MTPSSILSQGQKNSALMGCTNAVFLEVVEANKVGRSVRFDATASEKHGRDARAPQAHHLSTSPASAAATSAFASASSRNPSATALRAAFSTAAT